MQAVTDLITAWLAAHPKVGAALSALLGAVLAAVAADLGLTVPQP